MKIIENSLSEEEDQIDEPEQCTLYTLGKKLSLKNIF